MGPVQKANASAQVLVPEQASRLAQEGQHDLLYDHQGVQESIGQRLVFQTIG